MNGMMRTGALALLLAGTQLAGCGGGQAPVQAPRPVWVVQAVPGQGGTALGFPGDVHARQTLERPLPIQPLDAAEASLGLRSHGAILPARPAC